MTERLGRSSTQLTFNCLRSRTCEQPVKAANAIAMNPNSPLPTRMGAETEPTQTLLVQA
ncbi:MAG: hypothetical protein VKK42_26000 [Lyngbya sp.]|nr:hypothetical protein [Lyngbya sp.]